MKPVLKFWRQLTFWKSSSFGSFGLLQECCHLYASSQVGKGNETADASSFHHEFDPRGELWPTGVNLAHRVELGPQGWTLIPRGELWSLGGMFTPRGEHCLLFRRMEGQTSPLPLHSDKICPKGSTSPLGANFTPRGQISPLCRSEIKTGLSVFATLVRPWGWAWTIGVNFDNQSSSLCIVSSTPPLNPSVPTWKKLAQVQPILG
jgi:hypothetical protein